MKLTLERHLSIDGSPVNSTGSDIQVGHSGVFVSSTVASVVLGFVSKLQVTLVRA